MNAKYTVLMSALLGLASQTVMTKPLDGKSTDVLMQGFTWTSAASGNWYQTIAAKAEDMKSAGISMLWMPPPSEAESKEGYLPRQLNNLNSNYGTEAQLKSAIDSLHNNGIKAIADIVINHRNGTGNWHSFKNPDWGTDAIVSNDECWTNAASSCTSSMSKGAADSGDPYDAARDIDHSKDYVRTSIKTWLNERLKGVGFDGWRYDYVKGYHGKYVGEYNTASQPYFSVGEYWTTLYTPVENNSSGHRDAQSNWINQTGSNSAVFDFTTKGILNDVLGWYKGTGGGGGGNNNYASLKTADGKPAGLIGLRPKYAVTFVDNHDTGTSGAGCNGGQVHWALACDRVMEAYAYILTHPGIPSVYWGHYYDRSMKTEINKLLKIRRDTGLHSESVVNIVKAQNGLYAAIVDDKVAMKIGPNDWTPGTGWTLAASGNNYAVWTKGVPTSIVACFTPNDASAIKLGDAILFDASCSTAEGSSITSYVWTLNSVAQGTSKTQLVKFDLEKEYNLSLKVANSSGNSSEVKSLVVNLGKKRTYDALYLRGSFNSWGKTEMALTADNTWTLNQDLPAATEFKFDAAPGNWSINFGDIQADGIADGGTAPNIKVAAAGKYKITFNDKNKAYSVVVNDVCAAVLDNDGMDDLWEKANGLDTCSNDAAKDADGDGLTNLQEFERKTNPQNKDTDGDTYSDFDEVKANTDPLDKTKFPSIPPVSDIKDVLYRGDFDADGKGDVLWRNANTGELYVWGMNGTRAQNEILIAKVADSRWQIAALADFNADNKTDLLWRNSVSGETLLWLMNGAAHIERTLNRVATDFVPYALDANGDKKTDLFWRNNQTGENYLWILDELYQIKSETKLTTIPLEWQIKGLADIDGDGKSDITWRHITSDETAFWYMNGASYSEQMLDKLPNEWKIISTQDFDADSKGDLLWRNSKTNEVYLSKINNGRLGAVFYLGTIVPAWEVMAIGDYDANGKLDLFWRNKQTGDNAIGFFDAARSDYRDVKNIPADFSIVKGASNP